jgi:DNA-binding GntR family transcriptional regulator
LEKCPNSEILRVLGGTHILLIANHTMFDVFLGVPRGRVLVAIREHLLVFEHLEAGRFAEAAKALDAHLDSSAATWLDRFQAVSRSVETVIPPYLSKLV